jgi:hypothetical protein
VVDWLVQAGPALEPGGNGRFQMKRRILQVICAVIAVLIATGGIWAYSNGYYHALRGGIAESGKDFDEAIFYFKIAYEKNSDAFMVAYDIACCHALKGDCDSCFHWLRLALKSRYAEYARNYAKTDHDFDSVRARVEFQTLIYGSPPK